jgi:hypothetical protein
MRASSLSIALALLAGSLGAQQAPAAPPPACTAGEHRQFDFWLGRWSVADSTGRSIGESEITSDFGGCVIRERWNAATPFGGESLNAYDRVTRRWHQTWMDARGNVWKTDGGLVDGSMVLTRVGPTPRDPSTNVLHRWTWTPTGADRVRQHAEISADSGRTWRTTFDGRYTRKP